MSIVISLSASWVVLGLVDIFVMISKLPRKFVNDFFEDDRVDVLSKHVEEEPVAHLGLLDDDVNALLFNESEPNVQKVCLARRITIRLIFK